MAMTIVGLFDDHEQARLAVNDLVAAGFDYGRLNLVSVDPAGELLTHALGTPVPPIGVVASLEDGARPTLDLRSALRELNIPGDYLDDYAEGIRRGGSLLSVDTVDRDAREAATILNRHRAVDIDARREIYRRESARPSGPTPHAIALEDPSTGTA